MNSARRRLILLSILFGVTTFSSIHAQSEDIIGVISKEEIIKNDRIFEIYINRYEPEAAAINYLKAQQDSVVLIVFIGTWCKETKKYIPGLMKALEAAGSPFIQTKYVGVDAQKKIPKSFLKKFKIGYIPTVVVLKGNEEIGRIEEKPHQPIETDLVEILKMAGDK